MSFASLAKAIGGCSVHLGRRQKPWQASGRRWTEFFMRTLKLNQFARLLF
jgi:hypothetical protein